MIDTQFRTLFEQIQFEKVLSSKTVYGLIWVGTVQKQRCVIKMVILTSGLHYNDEQNRYMCSTRPVEWKRAAKCFLQTDPDPFRHQEFQQRRAMTPQDFFHEVEAIRKLSRTHRTLKGGTGALEHALLAGPTNRAGPANRAGPEVYGYGVKHMPVREGMTIDYGFLIMERMDCSLKDIFIQRNLTPKEQQMVEQAIDDLHEKSGMLHLDMKPSNIGVNLGANGEIQRCCFFDGHKIRERRDFDPRIFRKQIQKNLEVFQRHAKKNMGKDRKRASGS